MFYIERGVTKKWVRKYKEKEKEVVKESNRKVQQQERYGRVQRSKYSTWIRKLAQQKFQDI